MKFLSTIARALAVVAVLLGLGLSFVGSFVTISIKVDGQQIDEFGTTGWHEIGALGLLFPFVALALTGSAVGLAFARRGGVARILDGCAAATLLLAILVLIAFVISNKPDFHQAGFRYGLGWSGYVVLGLFGVAALLSGVAAALPGLAGEDLPAAAPHRMTAVPGAAPVENTKALWSMILGIVSFGCGAPITSIVAIVLATQANREIAASGGQQGGESKAKAGLILGIVTLALSILGFAAVTVILIAGRSNG